MSTQAIINPLAVAPQAAQSNSRASEAEPEQAFGEVLQRAHSEQRAERKDTNSTERTPKKEETRAAQPEQVKSKPAENGEEASNEKADAAPESVNNTTAKAETKDTKEGEEAAKPAEAQAEAAQTPADLLAMLAGMAQVVADASKPGAAAGGTDAALPGITGRGAGALETAFASINESAANPAAKTARADMREMMAANGLASRNAADVAQIADTEMPQFAAAMERASAAPAGAALGTNNAALPQAAAIDAAGLAPAALQQLAQAHNTMNTEEKLIPRVGTPGWDQAVGHKIVWMVAGAQQSATLSLNPPELGPMQIVLNVQNSHANAAFTAAQPEVRQALEAAMPRLREMLGDAGIQLGHASVSADSRQGGFEQPAQAARQSSNTALSNEGETISAPAARVQSGRIGMVDTFA